MKQSIISNNQSVEVKPGILKKLAEIAKDAGSAIECVFSTLLDPVQAIEEFEGMSMEEIRAASSSGSTTPQTNRTYDTDKDGLYSI